MNKRLWPMAAAGLLLCVVAGGWWLSRDDEVPAATRPPPAVTVRVAEARSGEVQAWIYADGTVRSSKREYLTFQNPGRITYVLPGLREGARVRAGQVLARQDQRQFQSDVDATQAAVTEAGAQQQVGAAELRHARSERVIAQRNVERFRGLVQRDSASAQELEQAQAELSRVESAIAQAQSRMEATGTQVAAAQARLRQARVKLEETQLVAPITGVAAYVNIEQGGWFLPSVVRTDSEQAALQTVPIVLIAPGRYEVAVTVPSFERGRLEPGQPALVEPADESGSRTGAAGPPAAAARGKVHSVTPGINPGARAIEVQIRVTEGATRLRDGLFVTTWIATASRADTLTVPLGALVYRENVPFVYVVDPARSTVQERRVTLGLQGLDRQEIRAGLQAGEQVVTEGRYQLSAGARVRVLADAGGAGGGTQ